MGTAGAGRYTLDQVGLDPDAAEPLHRQLCGQVRELIMGGAIPSGALLPSIRGLSAALGVSRNTVVAALDQLAAEGLVETRRGSGTLVASSLSLGLQGDARDRQPRAGLSSRGQRMSAQPRFATVPGCSTFHPGLPDLAEFPFKTWSRLMARRTRHSAGDLFGYDHVLGHPQLRSAIAGFLRTMRRVQCAPGQIVVTTGGQAALDLLARALLDEGDIVWMEEPGYLGARGAFAAAGARLQPLPVGSHGWTVSGRAPRPSLIYLTPSCQHPLGLTMPLKQRLQLLEAARDSGAWIIEDDFDGEYTFRGQPQPSMQGLTEDTPVIYVGTFAKVLFPAMRLGFMVVPEEIAESFKAVLSLTGQFAPLPLQAALADFIEQGYFFRHLNRMRRLYGQRRAAFVEHFQEYLGERLEMFDGRTGLQVAAAFRAPMDDRKVQAMCRSQGLNPAPLSLFYAGDAPVPGLLMGYAALSEAEMVRGLARLRDLLASVPG